MKKPTVKRLGLGLIQHLTAGAIMIAVAGILFNSYLTVESMKENHTYWLDPLDTEPEFEETDVFHDISYTAVSDIIKLVMCKEELETDGEFDPGLRIDVTRYAERNGGGSNCGVTAVYELEELIKWGKYGVEYSSRAMSMSDFVNYFGPAVSPSNFALDENGQLYFAGFLDSAFTPEKGGRTDSAEVYIGDGHDEIMQVVHQDVELQSALSAYTEEQLEDMAFSYIMANTTVEINMTREDDGSLTIYFPMLNCRYETVDGEKQLIAYAGNWVDYAKLQSNLADTINSLIENYNDYLKCEELYAEERTNLKYAVRMMTEDGIVHTYTNVSEIAGMQDSEIADYFSEYRRYFVYYPDDLEFTGNTSLTENDVYQLMNEYQYAYPEGTHIWVGVDTGYPVAGDAFYNANAVFQRIVPNITRIICVIVLLTLGWLGIGIYLTITAGVAYDDEGGKVFYLGGIDHIWTELLFLFAAVLIYAGRIGASVLMEVADNVYSSHSELLGMSMTKLYEYGTFGLYGALASMFFGISWFSLVRRIRSGNLWKGSFCCWILECCVKGVQFVLSHKNTAISTLLPYNLFLLVNLLGIFFVYILHYADNPFAFLIILGVALFDGLVGMWLFKRNAEHVDIVEGIRRIRDGEVDYKLETESLSGTNREMADAVNNIGEGIRKAVRTSMKDEQMKSDLITNVSHDIKTPLTSIISYVDLLKRLRIKEEPAKSYIDILDNKTQRLKQLTDDLVEASKISSGNIVLNMEKLNLTELLNQAIGEFSEKLEERRIQTVFEDNYISACIYADSRRMWRVVENLFNNICKYAMEGTRVYLDLSVADGQVAVSIKNISECQMNIRGEELTERFIRGDASRTTEGSGLGLFIAKSLTQAQGGAFEIQIDGDLFKAFLSFPEYVEEEHVMEQEP